MISNMDSCFTEDGKPFNHKQPYATGQAFKTSSRTHLLGIRKQDSVIDPPQLINKQQKDISKPATVNRVHSATRPTSTREKNSNLVTTDLDMSHSLRVGTLPILDKTNIEPDLLKQASRSLSNPSVLFPRADSPPTVSSAGTILNNISPSTVPVGHGHGLTNFKPHIPAKPQYSFKSMLHSFKDEHTSTKSPSITNNLSTPLPRHQTDRRKSQFDQPDASFQVRTLNPAPTSPPNDLSQDHLTNNQVFPSKPSIKGASDPCAPTTKSVNWSPESSYSKAGTHLPSSTSMNPPPVSNQQDVNHPIFTASAAHMEEYAPGFSVSPIILSIPDHLHPTQESWKPSHPLHQQLEFNASPTNSSPHANPNVIEGLGISTTIDPGYHSVLMRAHGHQSVLQSMMDMICSVIPIQTYFPFGKLSILDLYTVCSIPNVTQSHTSKYDHTSGATKKWPSVVLAIILYVLASVTDMCTVKTDKWHPSTAVSQTLRNWILPKSRNLVNQIVPKLAVMGIIHVYRYRQLLFFPVYHFSSLVWSWICAVCAVQFTMMANRQTNAPLAIVKDLPVTNFSATSVLVSIQHQQFMTFTAAVLYTYQAYTSVKTSFGPGALPRFEIILVQLCLIYLMASAGHYRFMLNKGLSPSKSSTVTLPSSSVDGSINGNSWVLDLDSVRAACLLSQK